MSLTPLDFIYNQSDSVPDYLEISSEVVQSSISWNINTDVNYAAKYKSYYTNISGPITLDKIFSYFDSYFLNPSFSYSFPLNYSEEELFLPGVRHLSPGLIVFERPPAYHHVSLSMDYRDNINDESEQYEWYLPIPWQVYIAAYNPTDMRLIETRMFFTNSSLIDTNQYVYTPPMFNFYSNGRLCRPFFDSIEDIEKYPQTISGVIASAFDWIWNSGFNLDITENISEFLLTKKYEQFEKYLSTVKEKKSYSYLVANPISSIGVNIPRSLLSPFFTCWESVPIEEISSINWSPYSNNDFFYQDMNDLSNITDLIDEYISIHNLSVHEYEDDHYDEDYDESSCPDNCITEEDLISSYGFRAFAATKKIIPNKTIHLALKQTLMLLKKSKIAQNKPSYTEYSKIHQMGSQILFPPS